MGLHDRDYIHDDHGKSSSRGKNKEQQPLLIISSALILRSLFSLVTIILCLRLPLIPWIKFPLLIVILIASWRWIRQTQTVTRIKPNAVDHFKEGRAAEAIKDFEEAIRHYEIAVGDPPEPTHMTVRLLAAYDGAGRLGQAKTLLQKMNGRKFPESAADELESIASNYFPIKIKRTPGGAQLVFV